MNSIDIADVKLTIKNYLAKQNFPAELKRLIVKEIYDEIKTEADNEIYREASDREATNEQSS